MRTFHSRVRLINAYNLLVLKISLQQWSILLQLKFGAYNSTKIESNLKRIEKLQSILKAIDDFNDTVATIFAKNKALLRKDGIAIGDFDLLISSFAIANGLIIVTNNIEHFGRIPKVQIENWVE